MQSSLSPCSGNIAALLDEMGRALHHGVETEAGAVPHRDLGRHPTGRRTEVWRTLSWHLGDLPAGELCAWASARPDGAEQLRLLEAALLLLGRTGDEARGLASAQVELVDPEFYAEHWSRTNMTDYFPSEDWS